MYEYRLKSLVLSNGFTFAPGKLTVIVGPNNSGKSRLLHDVKQLCTSQSPATVVVKQTNYTRPPSLAELTESYGIRPRFDPSRNQAILRTLDADMGGPVEVPVVHGSPAGWEPAYEQVMQSMLDQWDLRGAASFANYFGNYFVARLTTESRLLLAKEGPSGDPRRGTHNLLRAFYDVGKDAEQTLSALVERAFDTRSSSTTRISLLCAYVWERTSRVLETIRASLEKRLKPSTSWRNKATACGAS